MSKVILIIYKCCSGRGYRVYLGSTQLGSGTLLIATTSYVHSQYPNGVSYDIAVIQLPYAVSFTSKYCHTVINMYIILFSLNK